MAEHVRTCVIAGGGPAGMVAGLLLARGGVDVLVVEKHSDFLRDFRGDTIHPSTLELLDELGLMEGFAQIAHQKVEAARLPAADGSEVTMIDFGRLAHPYPYLAMAPQWDFLDLLAEAGEREPDFELRLVRRSPACCAPMGRQRTTTAARSSGSRSAAPTERKRSRRC